LDSSQAWSASKARLGEWYGIEVPDGLTATIAGVVTQARFDHNTQYVSKFRVSVSKSESLDPSAFVPVDGGFIFQGNSAPTDGRFVARFAVPIAGVRFVKIEPVEWNEYPSLRAGLLEIPNPEPSREFVLDPNDNSRSASSVWDDARLGTTHNSGSLDSADAWCARNNRVGEWVVVGENDRSASSAYENAEPGRDLHRGALHSHSAWSASRKRIGDWYQMDVSDHTNGAPVDVAGIAIQARRASGQMVTEFKVSKF
jgi:hypothetical protein